MRREVPLSTQGSLYLFLMLKQRYRSHVRRQLTDVCFQKCSKESKEREMYVHMYVCIHVSVAGVISNTCCSGRSNKIHFSHMSCTLTTGTRGGMEATRGSARCQEVTHKRSFGRSLVTTNQFRLCSCCAHSLGCCKKLAPSLIKSLIAGRTGQIVA